MSDLFAVLVSSDGMPSVASLGQALAAFKRVPLQDAAFHAKRCWGIVDENLAADDANRLIECLNKVQIPAVSVPQTHLPLLPAPVQLHHVTESESMLTGKDEKGQPHTVAWENIRVLSAAAFKSTTTKQVQEKTGPTAAQAALSMGIMMTTGLPIHIGGKNKVVEKTVSQTELIFSLSIITGSPSAHYYIPADNVDFSFLKERKLYNVMGNFKLMLEELLTRAPQAKRSKGTQHLISNGPLSAMGYESVQDVERECRWLLSKAL